MRETLWARGEAWALTHRDHALDVIRIYLGIAIFARGLLLLGRPEHLSSYVSQVDWLVPAILSHYVVTAHLGGGLLLALGLLTRLAAVVQIPALFGAVFMVHWQQGLLSSGQNLELASLVLFLLVLFAVVGGGRLSLDFYLFEVRKLLARRGLRMA